MLTDREADSVEIHVVDDKLNAELLREQVSDLHVDTDILVAVHILERLKARVGRYNELILRLVEGCGSHRIRSAVAEVIVADLVESAVAHDLVDERVHLFEKLRLSLIDAVSLLLSREVNVDDLNADGLAAAGCETNRKHCSRDNQGKNFFHCFLSP